MRFPSFKEMEPRTKKFLVYQLIALVVLIGASIVIGDKVASSYKTCTGCHEMNDSVKAWQGSSHEKITCIKCHHKEEGYYGFILGIPHKIHDMIYHVTGDYETPIRAKEQVENKVCQRCHVTWRNVSPSGDLIIPHERHFKGQNIPCVKCHSRVVHGEERDGEFVRRPAMQLCLSCHGGGSKTAPTLGCKSCHTEKAIPESHKNEEWFVMHSKVAKEPNHPDSNCKKCHGWTPTFCNNCHQSKRPSTHYGDVKWRTYHSERAKVRKDGCLVCHDKDNFCYRCHDPFEN